MPNLVSINNAAEISMAKLTHPVEIILWTESPPETLNYASSYNNEYN